ncbi:hypothetical protein QR680_016972 [Steinernema hermaphroditum]|uniref:DUF4781 domain-containing protein n=1 Tax=Steinernema hermaphroditum TaxID=289476 RepID=A0AA39HF22_9BILA|nr:hypothetical protein QR680_016972 [Steinernema hermaphroditum]
MQKVALETENGQLTSLSDYVDGAYRENDPKKELRALEMTVEETWKIQARETHRLYYESFRGRPWDEYGANDENLLLVRICFAVFGPPTDGASDDHFLAYGEKQRLEAIRIKDKLLEVRDMAGAQRLRVFVVFVLCRQGDAIFPVVVFRVATEDSDVPYRNRFVDCNLRTYNSWDKWCENNRLPEMEYSFPKFGYYTCDEGGSYLFDPEKGPVLEYGSSPACRIVSQVGRKLDTVSTVTSLVATGAAIVGLFTPLGAVVGPLVLASGATSAVYSAGRSAERLIDKGKHGESLTDLESVTSYVAIGLTPLSFATSATNAALAKGARESGRIFSTTTRAAATALNVATLGFQGGFVALGAANLYEKAKEERLTSLDCLQFSISLFFFTNTLVQPKTAAGIIKQAQRQHIQQTQNSMSDVEAKANFKRFIDQNIEDKGMTAQSKIVRTINRMDDPSGFFKAVSDSDVIRIGGRKGKTVIVSDRSRGLTRVNPNRLTANLSSNANALNMLGSMQRPLTHDLELSDRRDVANALRRVNGNVDDAVLETALDLGEKINSTRLRDLASVAEIVIFVVRDLKGIEKNLKLRKMTECGEFVGELKADIEMGLSIARENGRAFDSPVRVAHLFRLHGDGFAKILREDADFYLLESAQLLFAEEECVLQVFEEGSIAVKVHLMRNNEFGVLVEEEKQSIIGTTFKDMIFARKYAQGLLKNFGETETVLDLAELADEVGKCFGIAEWSPVFYTPFGIRELHELKLLWNSRCHDDVARCLLALQDAYGH